MLILAAGLLAYGRSFGGPFVFDDLVSIGDNPSIRHLADLGRILRGPANHAVTTAGRPLLNFSFAMNYAVSGSATWSYHAVNLVIHLLAGLTLFGVIRRTVRDDFVALAGALLWTVHPLQTESVTYIVQRAESLEGLFALLTLYCFIRERFRLAALSCLAAVATKETAAVIPVLVLAYDGLLRGGAGARSRLRWHALLFATWLPLGALVLANGGNRGGSIGVGTVMPWDAYLLTQVRAVGHYLKLAIWPHPLIFNYEPFAVKGLGSEFPAALVISVLLAATGWACVRRPARGFLGVVFWVCLAPTSLVPGVSQMIAEHRMYLALAAATVLAALALGRLPRGRGAALVILTAALAAATWSRNTVYASPISLWSDTLARQPDNAAAAVALGNALVAAGRPSEAIPRYEQALGSHPDYLDARLDLGAAEAAAGDPGRAAAEFKLALRRHPDAPEPLYDLAQAERKLGQREEAIASLRQAVALAPDVARYHAALSDVLDDAGQGSGAIAEYQAAARADPEYPNVDYNLGLALAHAGRGPEALAAFARAVQSAPESAPAHNNYAIALAGAGHLEAAAAEFRTALRLDPRYDEARENLAQLEAHARTP